MKISVDFNTKSDVQPQIEKLKSVRGMEWVLHKQDPSVVAMFMNRLGISEVLASIISNRNINNIDDAKAFLSPMLKDVMPDPKKLLDIDKATQRVIRALNDELIV